MFLPLSNEVGCNKCRIPAAAGGSKYIVLSSLVGCDCLTAREGDQAGKIDTFFLVVVIALCIHSYNLFPDSRFPVKVEGYSSAADTL